MLHYFIVNLGYDPARPEVYYNWIVVRDPDLKRLMIELHNLPAGDEARNRENRYVLYAMDCESMFDATKVETELLPDGKPVKGSDIRALGCKFAGLTTFFDEAHQIQYLEAIGWKDPEEPYRPLAIQTFICEYLAVKFGYKPQADMPKVSSKAAKAVTADKKQAVKKRVPANNSCQYCIVRLRQTSAGHQLVGKTSHINDAFAILAKVPLQYEKYRQPENLKLYRVPVNDFDAGKLLGKLSKSGVPQPGSGIEALGGSNRLGVFFHNASIQKRYNQFMQSLIMLIDKTKAAKGEMTPSRTPASSSQQPGTARLKAPVAKQLPPDKNKPRKRK